MKNTYTKINQIKSQLDRMLNGNGSRFQYHKLTDNISAYGHQLTSPKYLRGNADYWGNGRYVIAEFNFGVWETVHGENLL